MESRFWLGLDLGQRQDHTAMVLLTRVAEAEGGYDHVRWAQPVVRRMRVLHLARLPLGTRYLQVARKVREVVQRQQVQGRCSVVADATGVGLPVVEMLRAEDPKMHVLPVVITGGGEARCGSGVWHVPRRDLLGKMVAAFERGRVRIGRSVPLAGKLVEEIGNVRGDGRCEGSSHDDLAFALALAVWKAEMGEVGHQGGGRLL